MIKTYIIMRSDLIMSRAKFGVQCAHAMDLVWGYIHEFPTDKNIEWVEKYHRRKIILEISTLDKLQKLEEYFKENKIISFKIIDNGLTEFDGITQTGIVIPPYYTDEYLRSFPKFKRLQSWKDE